MRQRTRIRYGILDPANAVERDHPLARGLVAWWMQPPGMGAGGRLIDLMGWNHGTLGALAGSFALPSWGCPPQDVTAGLILNSANAQHADCGQLAVPTGHHTVMAHFRWNGSSSTNANFVCGRYETGPSGNDALYSIDRRPTSGLMRAGFRAVGGTYYLATTASAITANVTYCAGYVYDGVTVQAWMNGSPDGSAVSAAGVTPISPAGPFRVGYPGGLTTSPANWGWNGWILGVSVWHRALSRDEVRQYCRLSLAGYRAPDSPLRWLSTRTYSIPSAPPSGNRRRRIITQGAC